MNLDQVLIAESKSEVTDFSGTILYVGKSEKNEKGKSKCRQTVSVGESQEKSIWVTIWDGNYDIKVKGAKAVISKATVEVYKGKRRLNTTVGNVTITDIPSSKEEVAEAKPSPAGEVKTGAVAPKTVKEDASKPTGLPDVKAQLDGLLEYYEKKLTPKGYTTEDIRTIAATCFIELCKRQRKERY